MKTFSYSQKFLLTTALCGLLTGLGAQAFAQVPDAARSTADPGRIQDRFEDEAGIPDISKAITVKSVASAEAPPGAADIHFVLKDVRVKGANVYSQEELETYYADKIGSKVSLLQMYEVANDIMQKYRDDGYLTRVDVPPQTIENGTIELEVVEGHVSNIVVTGEGSESEMALVRAYAAQIKEAGVLNNKDLQHYLFLINDLPGVESRAILSRSPTDHGGTDIQIIVERDPYDAFIGVDNFGSRYLGPVEFGAAGAANSFFGMNERLEAQVVWAPGSGFDHEMAYGALSYLQPIFDQGTTVELGASYTGTEPGYILEQFDVKGQSRFFFAQVRHPFIRSRNQNLYGRFQLDWRDVESKNNLEATREDNLRVARVGGRYEILDELLFDTGINSIDVELAQGLDVLGSSDEGDANLSRAEGDPEFTKITAEIQRLQRVATDVNVLLAAKGQYTNDALLSSEEFGVGGIAYGRGYDPSEIVGDRGFAGKVEVQWNEPYQWDFVQDYQLFGFFDAGRTFNEDATTSALKTDTVTSAGFGIRADFKADTKAGLSVAFPLNRDVETQQDDDPRVYFNLSRSF